MPVTLNANTSTGFIATSDTSGVLQLQTGGTTAVTVDASQNVGIGTASPASDARLTLASPTTESYVMFSRTNSGVFDAAVGNNAGSLVFKGGADSATVAGLTEFMRIDSSGNVGIGTSSPDGRLHVHNGTAGSVTPQANADDLTVENNANAGISILSPDANVASIYFGSPASAFNAQIESGYNAGAPYLKFNTNAVERMRIDSSGNLLVGTTTSGGAGATSGLTVINFNGAALNGLYMSDTRTSAGSDVAVGFGRGTTVVGRLDTTLTSLTLTNLSDQRVKTNIQDSGNAIGLVGSIKVRQFDWTIDESHEDFGFVAQELNDVFPQAVSVGKTEEEMWGVNFVKLVPILTKAIQEQQAIITSLTDRITALEGAK